MEKKAARICWNNNGWKAPSGPEGKSKDKNSFEVNPGYGHEEWLLDFSKVIDGFKYSFLQGVNTKNQTYQGSVFYIELYTVVDRKKLSIGHIKRAECLTRPEAEHAVLTYQHNGWFDVMSDELRTVGADSSRVIEDDALLNFNIRFKPEDLVLYDSYKDVSDLYKSSRYMLFNLVQDSASDIDSMVSDVMDVCGDDVSETEKLQLISARVGQGVFRERVAKLWGGERCAVTLIDIKELLIASHIRPWRDCQGRSDRLDGANGLLLCAHIDKLFDSHLLSFELKNRSFRLRTSKKLDKKTLLALGIEEGIELDTNNLERGDYSRFEMYMMEHFNRFQTQESECT
ncbi:TPA: HNH endonuclease [Vibrio parahaemolyticus]|nr:HNH endonuclease signature motif containing protein [Vibrio parahaemolyticus]MCR9650480.1 HNH endonuclease [Vibrio parahaemolyticus]MCR9804481.1 HNH endonuclease [Vibrio parahaemolyticus]MDF4921281.1 HNH endonuclease signature motif containing protein [Vibrio parahaemolyticus]MDF5595603.1 HNH endonuclease signature motif containing protein [Vibrio parahaemolyticus]MDG3059382.1 HNH endonuclease signature motif containing protein [Vibrio parahaemolyticus]